MELFSIRIQRTFQLVSTQMDTLRTKHFRAESICLVFQNIQHRTEYSHLCLPPGLQSLDSAQMSN